MVEGSMSGGVVGVGKIWVALVALAAEVSLLAWLVGVQVWEWASGAATGW